MTAAQYRKALERLGLTSFRAGPILGISGRQSQRIAAGSSPVTVTIERLVTLLLHHGIPEEWKDGD